jgi:hypothetical protein
MTQQDLPQGNGRLGVHLEDDDNDVQLPAPAAIGLIHDGRSRTEYIGLDVVLGTRA